MIKGTDVITGLSCCFADIWNGGAQKGYCENYHYFKSKLHDEILIISIQNYDS